MSKLRLLAALVTTSALALTGSVMAQEETTGTKKSDVKQAVSKVKTECSADIERFCGDVTPGEGRIAACLQSKEDQISQSCNQARLNLAQIISNRVDEVEIAFRKSCGSDVRKYCSNVPSRMGRLYSCLSDHEEELSSSCQNFQAKVEQQLSQSIG